MKDYFFTGDEQHQIETPKLIINSKHWRLIYDTVIGLAQIRYNEQNYEQNQEQNQN
jgi:hypothetical protein